MSIPYPSDFEIDHEADRQWQREQAALRTLEIGDVLAEVDDLIAQEPDPAKHPLYSLGGPCPGLDHHGGHGHGAATAVCEAR
jgi:hypothetical protein